MQHLCTALCGLLVSCLCSWVSSESLYVIQSPPEIELIEGTEVQITCSWNISISHQAKVKWFKNNQKLELNQSDKFTETHKNINITTLVIKNTDNNDEGLYICEITQDIPQLMKANGTGTKVTYKKSTDDHKSTVSSTTQTSSETTSQVQSVASDMALGASASAAGVILSICVCVCVWWIKTRNRQTERVVIREGPPSEEEEAEHSEDGGSSETSRGSTEWYMVPLYEPYVDLRRNDDQKCDSSDTDAANAAAKKCLQKRDSSDTDVACAAAKKC